jgi:hypothetical protein
MPLPLPHLRLLLFFLLLFLLLFLHESSPLAPTLLTVLLLLQLRSNLLAPERPRWAILCMGWAMKYPWR